MIECDRVVCHSALCPRASVLVSGVRRPIPHGRSLLAGVVGCGRVGAGRGHRTRQVGVHVLRVGAAHGAAAGGRRGHGRDAAHAQRSEVR